MILQLIRIAQNSFCVDCSPETLNWRKQVCLDSRSARGKVSWFCLSLGFGCRATWIHSGSQLCLRWEQLRHSGSWWACRYQNGKTLSSHGVMALCTSPLWKQRKSVNQKIIKTMLFFHMLQWKETLEFSVLPSRDPW